jgi:hypothetical protein
VEATPGGVPRRLSGKNAVLSYHWVSN